MTANVFSNKLVGLAPYFMHFLLIASLLLCCVVDVFSYSEIFGANIKSVGTPLGLGFAVFIQFLRLGSALNGISNFKSEKYISGVLSLVFSFGLSIYVSVHYLEIAANWSALNPANSSAYKLVLQCLVWTGFFLETQMVVSEFEGMKVEKETEADFKGK